MIRRLQSAPSRRLSLLLLAAFVLLGQSLVGLPGRRLADTDTIPFGAAPICHAHAEDGGSEQGQHPHGMDCALCVVCHTLGTGAVVLGPAMVGPRLAGAEPSRPITPAAAPRRAPLLAATYPTGPPRLA